MDSGTAGGIVGTILGLAGGIIGTWAMIRGTRGPKERAVALQFAAIGWNWLAAVVAWLFLLPRPWNLIGLALNLPLLRAIPRGNRRLALARAEDEADAGLPWNRPDTI